MANVKWRERKKKIGALMDEVGKMKLPNAEIQEKNKTLYQQRMKRRTITGNREHKDARRAEAERKRKRGHVCCLTRDDLPQSFKPCIDCKEAPNATSEPALHSNGRGDQVHGGRAGEGTEAALAAALERGPAGQQGTREGREAASS